jgi:S1-C subfamily serine protease
MEINGKKVKGASDLYRVLDKCVVGDTVQVQVLRGNATEQLSIVLEPN